MRSQGAPRTASATKNWAKMAEVTRIQTTKSLETFLFNSRRMACNLEQKQTTRTGYYRLAETKDFIHYISPLQSSPVKKAHRLMSLLYPVSRPHNPEK